MAGGGQEEFAPYRLSDMLELRLLTRLYGIDDAPECPPDTSLPPAA